MPAILEAAKTTFLDGSAEDPFNPNKGAVIRLFGLIESILGSAVNGFVIGNAVVYQTRAALYADLTKPANTLGIVYGDSTAAYNGVYAKVGSSGSGNWTLTSLSLPSTVVADFAALISEVVAARRGSASLVQQLDLIVGNLSALKLAIQSIGKVGSVVTGTAVSGATFVLGPVIQGSGPGYMSALRLFALTAGLVAVKRFTKTGDTFTQVASDYIVPVIAGVNAFSIDQIGKMEVSAGEYLGFYAPGIISYTAGQSAGYWDSSSLGVGNQTEFTSATLLNGAIIQIGFDVVLGEVPDIAGKVSSIDTAIQTIGRATAPTTGPAAVSGQTWAFAVPVLRSGVVERLRAWSLVNARIVLKRFTKSGDNFRQVGPDYPVWLKTGLNVLEIAEIGRMEVRAGEFLGFHAPSGSVAYTTVVDPLRAYYATTGAGNVSGFADATIDSGASLMLGFDIREGKIAQNTVVAPALPTPYQLGEQVLSGSITAVGLSVLGSIDLSRNGVIRKIADAPRTLPATTSTNTRYDVYYYDMVDGTFGIVQGTERSTDATAFIPLLDVSTRKAIANLRVQSGAVTVIPLWGKSGGDPIYLSDRLDASRTIARSLLPKTVSAIRRGSPMRILAHGDSIQAIQSQGPSTTTPNGPYRDRGTAPLSDANHYLRDAYQSDVVDSIPLYTSVQLGRADDGSGAVHTKFGFMWSLVASLQRLGYTLGTDLFYDNMSVSGYQSSHSISGTTPTDYLNASTALPANLVVIHLGMNERGNVDSEARLILIAQAHQASAKEVLFMSCPRPRIASAADIAGWEFTNRAIQRAAEYTRSAYCDTTWIYDDRNRAVLGTAVQDDAAANGNNHPGINEHAIIGAEAAKTLGI